MSERNNSLINMDGLSDVFIKMLEMIEKAVGWTITPKGSQKDLEDALQYYKETILEDTNMPAIVKASKIASARKELLQYVNQSKIINNARASLKETATFKNIDLDWLSFFFDYAKNIQDESIQGIWANLLAEQCNGDTSIKRNLIHILSLMDTETAKAFTNLCRLVIQIPVHPCSRTFATRYIPEFVPVVGPYLMYTMYFVLPDDNKEKQAMSSCVSCVPSPKQLANLKELGLINMPEGNDKQFIYPYAAFLTTHHFGSDDSNPEKQRLISTTRKDYIINYFSKKYIITPDNSKYEEDPKNIKLGFIKFTSIGETLYKAIKNMVEENDGLLFFLTKYLETQGFNISY